MINFEPLTPEQRHRIILERKGSLIKYANNLSLPISLLFTGSTQYGYNSMEHGRLDDVDCIGILHSNIGYYQLFNPLKEIPDTESFDFPAENVFKDFLENRNGLSILRLSFFLEGVKISIHLIHSQLILKGINDSEFPLFNLIPKIHQRLIETDGKFEVLGTGQRMLSKAYTKTYTNDSEKILIREYFFKEDYFGGHDIRTAKGALGDKMLMAEIGYSLDRNIDSQIMEQLWSKFVSISYLQKDNHITPDDLINTFARYQRFSNSFINHLTETINKFQDSKKYKLLNKSYVYK